jgi:hypothetical protein
MTNKSPSRDEVANPTNLNVEAIAKLEHEALQRRSVTERASDGIVKLVGSIAFLLLQVLLVLTWSAINLNLVSVIKPFDPFPLRYFGSRHLVRKCLSHDLCSDKSKSHDASGGTSLASGSSGRHAC